MNFSAGHLSEIVKVQSGKPAIKHILERLVLVAKRLLFHGDSSLKEIAFDLGFADASFIGLLKQSEAPRIVNVTSGLGSLTLHNDPNWKYYQVKGAVYVSSKATLNAYTIVLAYDLRDTNFKVNAVDPGYTATDFNHHSGQGTVEDAAARVVKAAVLTADGPTGQFFSDDNNPETGISPW